MARVYQVPRHAMIWMMLAVVLAGLPHVITGPAWLGGLLLGAVLWRSLIHRGRLRMPPRVVRLTLLGAMVGGIFYHFGTLFGPTAGVSLLVGAFALKLLELFRLRDAYVVVLLGYFVLATIFLHQRGAAAALYVLVGLATLTAALIGINQPESGGRAREHIKLAAVMLIQALPLTVLLFLVMPRIAPLWSMETEESQARTGMSDSMAPGEVSDLSQNNDLAFRVTFDGEVPPRAQRYWRGMTYTRFDGRRWRQAALGDNWRNRDLYFPARGPRPDWWVQWRDQRTGPNYDYQVVMEPSRRKWLYALAVPFSESESVGVARDFRLLRSEEIDSTFAYRVTSYPDMPRGHRLTERQRERALELPQGFNPRTRERARQWRAAASTDQAYIERILDWLEREDFEYTLQPPELGRDSVDEFLFETRRGFCEHYASALTFMLRAAEIPARVVAGYQGGEVNPLGDHLRVRQSDAHAWVEAWLMGQGWVRLDPTAAVAPARIEYGLDRALEEQGGEAGGGVLDNLGDLPLILQMGYLSDYVEFAWYKWVRGYDQSARLELLANWLGKVNPVRVGLALAAGLAIILTPLAAWILLQRRAPGLSSWQREYWRMLNLLRHHDIRVHSGLPPRELVTRVAQRNPPAAEVLEAWSRDYEHLVYGPDPERDRAARQRLRRERGAVRRALRRR